MKKLLSIVLSLVIIFSCLPFAASAHEIEEEIQVVPILENYPISQLSYNACSHSNIEEVHGPTTDRDCYNSQYIKYILCADCGYQISATPVTVIKATPTHTCIAVSISCNGSTHTYGDKCTKCGAITRTYSHPCHGGCAEFNSISHEEVE